MQTRNLQAKIMRRVYYTYALSIATHSMLWRGAFLGAAALLLARWLHVASIIKNLLATPVGNVPSYVLEVMLDAAQHGKITMLLTLFLAAIVGLSSLYHLLQSLPSQRLSA